MMAWHKLCPIMTINACIMSYSYVYNVHVQYMVPIELILHKKNLLYIKSGRVAG